MRLILATFALLAPATLQAQAYSCSVPGSMPSPRADGPSASQPRRLLPIGGYTLAITWAPNFCRENGRRQSARFQCGAGNRFGWTLHGLWPDGQGKDWPQYCRAAQILRPAVIRANMCSTPSAQLIQHEWAKHGTCMAGYSPERYFGQANALYRRLRFPDMEALSRRQLTAGGVAQAMARANPGLRPDMMRITADRQGWVDEIWLCMNRQFRYQRCPAHQGGLATTSRVRVWRGPR
jgi:ribonuclease T2